MDTKKYFYVTFMAQVDNELKEVKVGKPFRQFDTAVQFAESATKAWENSLSFKYVNYSVSFRE